MKDELISFDCAKLAKEKGFNGSTRKENYYSSDSKLNREMEWRSFDSDIHIFAPTQSLLQRWLREKHNIIVQSIPIFSLEDELFWKWDIILNHSFIQHIEGSTKISEMSKTYEKALEQGLIEGLNLIP